MSVFKLERDSVPLIASVIDDEVTQAVIKPFDLSNEAPREFYPFIIPKQIPEVFGIGLIVGASGSGKSQLLKRFSSPMQVEWVNEFSIAAHFPSAEEAMERFYAVGLNSVPTWRLPYSALSNGQQFRADLARLIGDNATVDEFTSVVDRNVAISASKALNTWTKRNNVKGMVFASCHRDIIDWLNPDWTIDTDAGTLTIGSETSKSTWFVEHITGDKVGRLVLTS